MSRFAPLFLLFAGVFLTSCAGPNVHYSDLRPPPTATVSGDLVTIHLGSDLANSACYTRPKTRVERQTVFVSGYRTLQEQKRDILIRLPASISPPSATVVWVEPGGRRIPLSLKQ